MSHTKIGDGEVIFGEHVKIGDNVKFIFSKNNKITIGNNVTIGDNTKFIVSSGDVCIGDWTTIHEECLVLSEDGVSIGEHGWFGRNTIIDGTGGLIIKNGVRVGMYSQIWTHVAAGELIEGCRLIGKKAVVLENDVWLVGSCTVSSGVTIGEKAICLNGSNVTKSVIPNAVVAGSPAVAREKLKFYKPLTPEAKYSLMSEWMTIFSSEYDLNLEMNHNGKNIIKISKNDESLYMCLDVSDYESVETKENECKMCIETKKYNKTQLFIERLTMKYLSSNKARFYS